MFFVSSFLKYTCLLTPRKCSLGAGTERAKTAHGVRPPVHKGLMSGTGLTTYVLFSFRLEDFLPRSILKGTLLFFYLSNRSTSGILPDYLRLVLGSPSRKMP